MHAKPEEFRDLFSDKADRYAATKGFDTGKPMTSRLAPDMQSFTYQVQSACDYAQGGCGLAFGTDATQARR